MSQMTKIVTSESVCSAVWELECHRSSVLALGEQEFNIIFIMMFFYEYVWLPKKKKKKESFYAKFSLH